MSIHKSKGLEFPIVFVGGLGKKFNLRDTYKDIIMHKDLGFGPKFIDFENRVYSETLPRLLIKRNMKMESLAEEMRILYVAFTRAVDKLIFVGAVGNVEKKYEKWSKGGKLYNLMSCGSYLEWMMSILAEHTFDSGLDELVEIGSGTLEAGHIKLNVVKDSELDNVVVHGSFKGDFDDLLNAEVVLDGPVELLDAIVIEEATAPSKISVTELKTIGQANIDDFKMPELVERPKFMSEEKKLTGSEIGNLYHQFMQNVSLEKIRAGADVGDELDLLLEQGVFRSSEVSYIKVDKLSHFMTSEIGQRLLASDQVYREKPFVLQKHLEAIDNKVLIQGIIDCYFVEKDGIVLIDYKTDYLRENEDQVLVEKYRIQLDLYKEAIEGILKIPVKETYLYSFSKDKAIQV